MDANDLRTENIRSLVGAAGGPTVFAALLGDPYSPTQVSQWISSTNPKGIGKRLAREIEARRGLPRGWLDQDHSGRPAGSRPIAEWDGESQLPDTHQGMQRIEVYLSAGNGCSIAEAEPPAYLTPNVFRAEEPKFALAARGWQPVPARIAASHNRKLPFRYCQP